MEEVLLPGDQHLLGIGKVQGSVLQATSFHTLIFDDDVSPATTQYIGDYKNPFN